MKFLKTLIKHDEATAYCEEIRLFMDPDGILRCAGQFQNAPLDIDAYPVLQPKPSTDRFISILVQRGFMLVCFPVFSLSETSMLHNCFDKS